MMVSKSLHVLPASWLTALGGSAEPNRTLGVIDLFIGGDFIKDVAEAESDVHVDEVVTLNNIKSWYIGVSMCVI